MNGRTDSYMHGFDWKTLEKDTACRDLGADGRIILKLISRKWDVQAWTRLDSGDEEVVGFCEYGDEQSGSINCGEFLD
jgi:hypothetical protein